MNQAAPRIAVRVAEVVALTPLVKRFRLAPLDGVTLPAFSGGAHVVVELPVGDVVRRNPYSLSSPPSNRASYTISVRRDAAGRGGSRFLHDHVGPGTLLQISHPANLFAPAWAARRHLLLAGGIGITPFVAMVDQLHRDRRDFALYYAAKSRAHAAHADELVGRYGDRVQVFCSDQGERIPCGRVLDRQPLGTHLYVCGPARMIAAAVARAQGAGWPEQNIHLERFIAPATGQPYAVRLARSALDVKVGAHQSMLEAIEAAGIAPPFMCRGGACGQCEATVLHAEGRLLHADHFLTDAERASGEKIMPCVSRFEGERLVLDL